MSLPAPGPLVNRTLQGAVCCLTLSEPSTPESIAALCRELQDVVQTAQADAQIEAILVFGRGPGLHL